MNSNINPQNNTTRAGVYSYILTPRPHFHRITWGIASRNGYYTPSHPIFNILSQIDNIVDNDYIKRDSIKKLINSQLSLTKKNSELREELIKTKKQVSKLKSILKLLRVKSDELVRYEK